MKNILLLTDFSATAENAVIYGYRLARQLKANVLLCNVMNIPAEIPQFEVPVLPLSGYDHMVSESKNDLDQTRKKLEGLDNDQNFHSFITCIEEVGRVVDTVFKLVQQYQPGIVIVGIHSNKGLVEWFLGNHVSELIDIAKVPVLVVPAESTYHNISKIALASDSRDIDLDTLELVSAFAEKLNAELFLFRVADQRRPNPDHTLEQHLTARIKKLTDQLRVSVKTAIKGPVEKQLKLLCEAERIDLLVMTHRKRSLMEDILSASHSRKMAGKTNIPLLIIPEKNNSL
ncbi:universal stress protein [Pedobacter ginsengisoli]|uniref:universal stress protein n=1 Tax=Pedobacter ginsengisoli TaxID=363852 RepID=UPI00254D2E9B|nr:universal stress protein [Pedobacter ginsengisoli]